MRKLMLLTAIILATIFISGQAFPRDYGITSMRVHPKVIKPGDEVTVNMRLTGEFFDGNPQVSVFVDGHKMADNAETANQQVCMAPIASIKFVAGDEFVPGRNPELKAVLYYGGNQYPFVYPNSQNKDFCADAPWRVIGTSASVPVEATIFDADQWGCNLDWISIQDVNNGNNQVAYYDAGGASIDIPRWSYLFDGLHASDFVAVDGTLELLVQMHYRELIFINYDFYQYLKVKVADEPFPKVAGWYYGDTHYHTAFTDNFNERGGSFAMIGRCGPAIGLDWTMTTDHASNNSGNQWPVGDFANDLQESEWPALGDSCATYANSDFKIIRGEEVTVKNDATIPGDDGATDNTSHMLTLANPDYIEGPVGPDAYPADGDHSNLKSLGSRLQLLQNMPYGIAYSAHPADAWIVSVYEDIIPWSTAMYDTALGFSRFKGLELFNERNFYYTDNPDYVNPDEYINPFPSWQPVANWDSNLVTGLQSWDSLLCANLNPIRKIFAAGGSDGHGDFNYHYYGLTLLTYSSILITDNAFGKVRTAVYCPTGMGNNGEQVYSALAQGKSVVTDGPFVIIGIDSDGNGSVFGPHDAIMGGTATNPGGTPHPKLVCYWKSTPEFGPIEYMNLIVGTANGTTVHTKTVNGYTGYVSVDITPFVPPGQQRFYYRMEAYCPDVDGLTGYRCITNPVWVDLASQAASPPSKLTDADINMDNLLNGRTEK